MKKNKNKAETTAQTIENEQPTAAQQAEQPTMETADEQPNQQTEPSIEDLKQQIADLEDKNLRMMAEFDNYRRRTNKEKLDLMATAGEGIFKDMLPLIDDFERSIHAAEKYDSIDALREGLGLIYQKFIKFLEDNKVTAIDTADADFDTDLHEAITTFAAGEDKKGKIIDCTQKGYKLGEKVIRFAKVVVGE